MRKIDEHLANVQDFGAEFTVRQIECCTREEAVAEAGYYVTRQLTFNVRTDNRSANGDRHNLPFVVGLQTRTEMLDVWDQRIAPRKLVAVICQHIFLDELLLNFVARKVDDASYIDYCFRACTQREMYDLPVEVHRVGIGDYGCVIPDWSLSKGDGTPVRCVHPEEAYHYSFDIIHRLLWSCSRNSLTGSVLQNKRLILW